MSEITNYDIYYYRLGEIKKEIIETIVLDLAITRYTRIHFMN